MKVDSIAFRLTAGAALLIGAALVVSGFMLAAIFGDHIRAGLDRRLSLLLESLIAVSEISESGALVLERAPGEPLFDQPYSGLYWQIDRGDGFLWRSRSLWDKVLVLAPRSGEEDIKFYEADGPQGQRLRVLERGITLPGSDRTFRYAVAADLALLEAERRPFDTALAWSLGILWVGLMLAVFVQIHYGLRPLRRIRQALADVRAGRSARLTGTFPAEITPLADELNAHLHQISEVVDRARTHVGNLAHSLKTPLSVLTNDAAQASGPFAKSVQRQSEIMGRRIDHYLVRARTAATAGLIGARTDLVPVVDDLRRTLLRIHRERDLDIVTECDGAAAFRGDRQDVEEIIGNIMDNACKWARSRVLVRLATGGGQVRLSVEDDGPGLAPEQRADALARGGRLDETVPGTGLGLSIVQEIAGLYGGSVDLGDAALGGLRVDVVLPAAEIADPN